jgi:phosphoglycolate phosphatase-like HAD superfamily hydrolase
MSSFLVPSTLFLDFDGTLVESQKTIYHAVCHIFKQEGLQPPLFEEYYLELRHPFIDFYRSRGVKASEAEISKIFDHFMSIHWYDTFADVAPFLQSAHFKDYTIVAISGNSVETIERVFQEHMIRPYFHSIIGRAYDKESAFRQMMSRLNVSPDQVVAIGDWISDVEGAKASGIERSYGILRGRAQTSSIWRAMKQAGARAVVGTLGDVWNYEKGYVCLSR